MFRESRGIVHRLLLVLHHYSTVIMMFCLLLKMGKYVLLSLRLNPQLRLLRKCLKVKYLNISSLLFHLTILYILIRILQNDLYRIVLYVGNSLVPGSLELLPPFDGFDFGFALEFPLGGFLFIFLFKAYYQYFLEIIDF